MHHATYPPWINLRNSGTNAVACSLTLEPCRQGRAKKAKAYIPTQGAHCA